MSNTSSIPLWCSETLLSLIPAEACVRDTTLGLYTRVNFKKLKPPPEHKKSVLASIVAYKALPE